MVQYPMHFEVSGQASPGSDQTWSAHAHGHRAQDVTLAIPPQFDGPGGGFSPEDIYALALQNCFVATFKVFAEKSRLQYSGLTTSGTLTVDRSENGVPWMAAFALRVKIEGVAQKDVAERLLQNSSKNCLIINSVRTACSFDFEVVGASDQPGAAN